jgi:hypothetical protein
MIGSCVATSVSWALALVVAACASSSPPPPLDPPGNSSVNGTSGRPAIAQRDCEAQGATVVGDIGDGATHRPDYLCASGKPPLGDIKPPDGGPIAVEGSVCCPK